MFQFLKALFSRKTIPLREYFDVNLGRLTAESTIWSGEVTRDGVTIPFSVSGSNDEPSRRLLDCVRDIVDRFRVTEAEGKAFLFAEIPEVERSGKLTFHNLEFLWEDAPGIYAMEWVADEEDFCVWRVNFEGGRPKEAGFDD